MKDPFLLETYIINSVLDSIRKSLPRVNINFWKNDENLHESILGLIDLIVNNITENCVDDDEIKIRVEISDKISKATLKSVKDGIKIICGNNKVKTEIIVDVKDINKEGFITNIEEPNRLLKELDEFNKRGM